MWMKNAGNKLKKINIIVLIEMVMLKDQRTKYFGFEFH